MLGGASVHPRPPSHVWAAPNKGYQIYFFHQHQGQCSKFEMIFYLKSSIPVTFKGSDRLCKVIELSMQSCRKLLSDSFETYFTFLTSVNPEFELKFDVQNS